MRNHDSARLRRLQRERSNRRTERDSAHRRRLRPSRELERHSRAPKAIALSLLGLGLIAALVFCATGGEPELGSARHAAIPTEEQTQTSLITPKPQPLSAAPAAPPSAPHPPQADEASPPVATAPAAPEKPEETPTFATTEEALNYVQRNLPACPKTISFHYTNGSNNVNHETIAKAISSQAGVHCSSIACRGNTLTFFIDYGDDAILLAHHRGTLDESRLNDRQRKLYRIAQELVRLTRASHADDYELARALHDWVVLNSRYVMRIHPDGELASILLHGEGLCECYARTFALLTNMAGLECRLVSGSADGVAHAWNIIKLKGKWAHVDCTYDDPVPDVPGRTLYFYFGIGDASISKNHRWERSDYPACPTDGLWYALHHTPRFATVEAMAAALVAKASTASGEVSLDGFVEELVQHPERESKLIQSAVRQYKRGMGVRRFAQELSPGFITLTTRGDRD